MSEGTPRLDGLYVAAGNDSSTYLRFSPGDKVSRVTSTGNPAQVFKWLTPDNSNSAQGTYAVSNGRIRFTITSRPPLVTYEGTITNTNDGSRLVILSPWTEVYDFTPLGAPSGEPPAPAPPSERQGSKSRFSVAGKALGYLSAGPHVNEFNGEFWPVINITVSDGARTVSTDFPIGLAAAMITEMQRIIAEYGDGTEVPRNWGTPF